MPYPYRHDLIAHAFYNAAAPDTVMDRLAHYRLDDAREYSGRPGVGLAPIGPYVVVALMAHPADVRKLRAPTTAPAERPLYFQEPERLVLRQWFRELFAAHLAHPRYTFHRAPLEPFLARLASWPAPGRPPAVPDLGELVTEPQPRSGYLRRAQEAQAVRVARGLPIAHEPQDRPFYGSMANEHAWSAEDTRLVRAALESAGSESDECARGVRFEDLPIDRSVGLFDSQFVLSPDGTTIEITP
jgi:hypothetical protein